MQMKMIIIRMIFMLNIHAIKERARKSQHGNSTCPFCHNFAPFEVCIVDVWDAFISLLDRWHRYQSKTVAAGTLRAGYNLRRNDLNKMNAEELKYKNL